MYIAKISIREAKHNKYNERKEACVLEFRRRERKFICGNKKKCLVEETEYNLDMIKTLRFKDDN